MKSLEAGQWGRVLTATAGGDGRRGQSLTEYIVIVALVAIAAVGVVLTFGNNIRKLFDASTDVTAGMTPTQLDTHTHDTKYTATLADFPANNADTQH